MWCVCVCVLPVHTNTISMRSVCCTADHTTEPPPCDSVYAHAAGKKIISPVAWPRLSSKPSRISFANVARVLLSLVFTLWFEWWWWSRLGPIVWCAALTLFWTHVEHAPCARHTMTMTREDDDRAASRRGRSRVNFDVCFVYHHLSTTPHTHTTHPSEHPSTTSRILNTVQHPYSGTFHLRLQWTNKFMV